MKNNNTQATIKVLEIPDLNYEECFWIIFKSVKINYQICSLKLCRKLVDGNNKTTGK